MNIITNHSKEYNQLLNECREIITECEFASRWALIEGYHFLGTRILQEKNVTVTKLAKDLNKSERTIQRAIQFAKKYPDLAKLPEGKNTSWHQISNKYLVEPKEVEPCMHEEIIKICKKCRLEIIE